ncbi:group II intron reverse transcriptase/maturase [Lysobacteraceae bacterium NML75-0749]|nr:group II intron reverse transcriptase/maturase [Xanthomonadaceae bacterium NML75-0749]PJK03723.1 group II intron reverse transcriptase/maturase [Xanthomonadaceae bacterium NML91-0268]
MDACSLKSDVTSCIWMSWTTIPWDAANQHVRRLQARISKAATNSDWRKVKRLQKLLVRSSSSKAIAVRRITENQGRRTPGVDKVVWSTSAEKWKAVMSLTHVGYKPLPLRRIHIPKSNGGKRPLGIPTMRDRAMQALFWLALDPVSEAKADPNSYGFRTFRSTADAMKQCENALNRKASPQWVLEGDIKGCFDNINHDWLMRHVPMERSVLSKWLKSGYTEGGRLYPTEAGTPQGGIISPVLANLTLDGLERLLKDSFPRRAKLNFVRYADDFIVTAVSKELLEEKVKPLITGFLVERGLALSEIKTVITHVSEGFDFLGFRVQKFKDFLHIGPSPKSTKALYAKVTQVLRRLRGAKQVAVIRELNPILSGWANYHRAMMATRTFAVMDHRIFWALWRWAKRRHPTKNSRWVKKRYFKASGSRNWVFSDGVSTLVRLSDHKKRRHIKIKSDANPYDPSQEAYFDEVLKRRMLETLAGRRKLHWLWKRQEGKCPWCHGRINKQTGWNIHHRVWRSHGGSDKAWNLELLHPTCHAQLHARTGLLPPAPSGVG